MFKHKYNLMNVNSYFQPFPNGMAKFFIIKSFNEENIFKVRY